jgi:hypothetical protein
MDCLCKILENRYHEILFKEKVIYFCLKYNYEIDI